MYICIEFESTQIDNCARKHGRNHVRKMGGWGGQTGERPST